MNNYYANDKNENLPHDQCLNNKPNFNRNNSQNNHVNGYNTNMREMNPEYMDYKYSNNWNQNSNSHIQRNESNNLNYSRPQNFENVPNMYKIPQNMNYMYQNDFQYQNFNTNSNFNENHNPNVNFNRFRNNSYSGPIRSYNPHMYQDMPRTSNYQKYPQFKTKKPPNFSYSEKEISEWIADRKKRYPRLRDTKEKKSKSLDEPKPEKHPDLKEMKSIKDAFKKKKRLMLNKRRRIEKTVKKKLLSTFSRRVYLLKEQNKNKNFTMLSCIKYLLYKNINILAPQKIMNMEVNRQHIIKRTYNDFLKQSNQVDEINIVLQSIRYLNKMYLNK